MASAADPRFATNPQRVAERATLIPMLEAHFATRPAAEWLALLTAAQVPAGPVNNLAQVFADPQVQQQQLRSEVQHPVVGAIGLLSAPFTLSDTPAEVRLPPPLLGQHTEAILRELGYPAAEIDVWRERGVV
jgi:crotonobetainyl-CoA:carnitine CoA-transferase CaiB-like acyl-CoA transferase